MFIGAGDPASVYGHCALLDNLSHFRVKNPRLAAIKLSRSSEHILTTVEAQILAATIYLEDEALKAFA